MTAAAALGRHVGAVLVAAGRGERLGGDRPKALVEVAGRPLFSWAVANLRRAGVEHLVVVHTPGEAEAFAGATADAAVVLTPGGKDRSASVRAGLAALPDEVTVVAVHDAARAFTPPEVVRAVITAVGGEVLAAAPALPVADTLKRVAGQRVEATVDRRSLVAVQTPQVFPRTVLEAVVGGTATDDLALVEEHLESGDLTGRIVWVPGSPRGLKVTYPDDLAVAETFAATEAAG